MKNAAGSKGKNKKEILTRVNFFPEDLRKKVPNPLLAGVGIFAVSFAVFYGVFWATQLSSSSPAQSQSPATSTQESPREYSQQEASQSMDSSVPAKGAVSGSATGKSLPEKEIKRYSDEELRKAMGI